MNIFSYFISKQEHFIQGQLLQMFNHQKRTENKSKSIFPIIILMDAQKIYFLELTRQQTWHSYVFISFKVNTHWNINYRNYYNVSITSQYKMKKKKIK